MNWAGITILSLHFIVLLITANRHGQKKDETYNIWWSLLSLAIMLFLYYKAGMFT